MVAAPASKPPPRRDLRIATIWSSRSSATRWGAGQGAAGPALEGHIALGLMAGHQLLDPPPGQPVLPGYLAFRPPFDHHCRDHQPRQRHPTPPAPRCEPCRATPANYVLNSDTATSTNERTNKGVFPQGSAQLSRNPAESYPWRGFLLSSVGFRVRAFPWDELGSQHRSGRTQQQSSGLEVEAVGEPVGGAFQHAELVVRALETAIRPPP